MKKNYIDVFKDYNTIEISDPKLDKHSPIKVVELPPLKSSAGFKKVNSMTALEPYDVKNVLKNLR